MDLPRWGWMWLLSVVIFTACKAATLIEARRVIRKLRGVPAYLLAWPGLDARSFLGHGAAADPALRAELAFAIGKTLLGLALLFAAMPLTSDAPPLVRGWVGMLGLIFTLHFGLFHVLSCVWRMRGVAAKPLMRWPIASTSLGGFWGQRWNTAFRDLTHRLMFRPLSKRIGAGPAVWVVFAFSGVVHDAVISLPAGGGYGLPTAYFLLQVVGLWAERQPVLRAGLKHPVAGWCWTAGITALPAPLLLFHPPFVEGVMLPFFLAIGAG